MGQGIVHTGPDRDDAVLVDRGVRLVVVVLRGATVVWRGQKYKI